MRDAGLLIAPRPALCAPLSALTASRPWLTDRIAQCAQQLALGEWFDEPLDDALTARAMVEGRFDAREHDDWELLQAFRHREVIEQLEAAAVRKLHVEENYRRAMRSECLTSRASCQR